MIRSLYFSLLNPRAKSKVLVFTTKSFFLSETNHHPLAAGLSSSAKVSERFKPLMFTVHIVLSPFGEGLKQQEICFVVRYEMECK